MRNTGLKGTNQHIIVHTLDVRNQKGPLSLKRKQQVALATIDLIFLASTPANVISSEVLKQKLK